LLLEIVDPWRKRQPVQNQVEVEDAKDTKRVGGVNSINVIRIFDHIHAAAELVLFEAMARNLTIPCSIRFINTAFINP